MSVTKKLFNTTRSILLIIGSVVTIILIGAIILAIKKNKLEELLKFFNKETEKIHINTEIIKENIKNTKKETEDLENKEKKLEKELDELDKHDGTVDYPSTGDLTDDEILKAFREKQKEFFGK